LGDEDGLRWLVREGRLRALWRVLLFALLFLGLVMAQLLVVAATIGVPATPDRIAEALLVQAVAFLVAALAAGWALLRWVDRRPLRDLGFALERRVFPDLATGVAIGAAGLAAAVLVLALAGAFEFTRAPGSPAAWLGVILTALLFFALPAAAEEAVFRGYPFRALVEGIGPVGATLIMSALFAWVHGVNPNVGHFGMLNIFAAGIMLSLAVLWTGSLWFASAVHLGWNWAMAALLDLPVSGLDLFDAPLYDAAPTGPAWLTGGAFGPEGGVAGSMGVLLAVVLLWRFARRTPHRPVPAERRDEHVEDR
jgi:uncharacterized protein